MLDADYTPLPFNSKLCRTTRQAIAKAAAVKAKLNAPAQNVTAAGSLILSATAAFTAGGSTSTSNGAAGDNEGSDGEGSGAGSADEEDEDQDIDVERQKQLKLFASMGWCADGAADRPLTNPMDEDDDSDSESGDDDEIFLDETMVPETPPAAAKVTESARANGGASVGIGADATSTAPIHNWRNDPSTLTPLLGHKQHADSSNNGTAANKPSDVLRNDEGEASEKDADEAAVLELMRVEKNRSLALLAAMGACFRFVWCWN
jgi:hypothetical protein